jgi:predicted RNA-binding Zn-ribbon protein involved in translation (DUF1610 family)
MAKPGLKVAQVMAATVEVLCPHCGEPQPSPDNGSHAWFSSQVSANQGPRTCVSCDERFQIHAQNRVMVQS